MQPSKCHVIIRADASADSGIGHIMRMMALGQALVMRGATVSFIVGSCPETLLHRLEAASLEIIKIPESTPGSDTDAAFVRQHAKTRGANWIVLDGYHFSHAYQRRFQGCGSQVLAVDDHLYSDTWCVDLLLNQNLHASTYRTSYQNAAPETELLLGLDFTLMRPEFWQLPSAHHHNREGAKRVLVTMGGADPVNATAIIMHALLRLPAELLRISILIGSSNLHRSQLEEISQQHPGRFELLAAVESMSSLLIDNDYVITAGGSTCWEILWSGCRGAVFVIAENQQPIADSLQEQNLMLALGRWDQTTIDDLSKKLISWFRSPRTVTASSIVDGKGAKRVAAYLEGRYSITIATAESGWLLTEISALKTALEEAGHRVTVGSKLEDFDGGDFLFLLSYWGIVPRTVLDKYLHSLVVHASDLPNGRGWSPATWHILEGRDELTICLLEASAKVDRGDIYYRDRIHLKGDELVDEWRNLLVIKTADLCLRFIKDYPQVLATRERQPESGTYYPRRTPADSRLDTSKTLEQLFNQLRVADNRAYPAYFEHLGQKYLLKIEKAIL